MTNGAKPYSFRRTVFVALTVSIAFLLLSLMFLFMQAQNSAHRIVGEIIAVSSDRLQIRNGRGDVTNLTVQPDASFRGVSSLDDLANGQHIMMRGDFADDGSFLVERLRLVKEPRKE